MTIAHAIPTRYRGVEFRSRIEARWAAFFDLVGWNWHYEPIDLEGYIPDFILDFHEPFLVEIKHTLDAGETSLATAKIARSGWDGAAAVFGALWTPSGCSDCFTVGTLRDICWHPEGWDWPLADIIVCGACESPSIGTIEGGWLCYKCGEGGKWWQRDRSVYDRWDLFGLWNMAGNRVQWRPR